MTDFDKHLDDKEDQEITEALVQSIKAYRGERCCVFLEADTYSDTVHGKLVAFIREFPGLMIRDLTPGKERLQRKRLIMLEAIRDVCFVPTKEKCKECPVFIDLSRPDEDPPGEEKGD